MQLHLISHRILSSTFWRKKQLPYRGNVFFFFFMYISIQIKCPWSLKLHICLNTNTMLDMTCKHAVRIKTPIETLGIHITNNLEESFNNNFKPKISTFKNLLQIQKQRTLTSKGKITIVNTLALSPLIYVSSLIDTLIDTFVDQRNDLSKH